MARPGLRQHPKFKRLVHLLGAPVPHVLGYLECLWDVGYQSGNPRIGDATDVELAAEFPGTSGALVAALLESRLLDETSPGQYEIHDLLGNAPDYVKKRIQRAIGADAERRTVSAEREKTAHLPAQPSPGFISAEKSAEREKSAPARKRAKGELFLAVAEITGSDPDSSATHIGRIVQALRQADPPYTPAEVRSLPGILVRHRKFRAGPITLGAVTQFIGLTRSTSDEAKMAEERARRTKEDSAQYRS